MAHFIRIISVLFLLISTGTASAATYSIVDLGTLGGFHSKAYAVNNQGVVVGASSLPNYQTQAFVSSSGGMTGTGLTLAAAVNEQGTAVGHISTNAGQTRAAMISGGSVQTIGPEGYNSAASGINSSGTIVGKYNSGDSSEMGFIYDGNDWRDLVPLAGNQSSAWDINDQDQAAGLSSVSGGSVHAVRYDKETPVDLGTLGGRNSYGQGINDLGYVVGYADTAGGLTHAFLHNGVDIIDLSTLGGDESYAYAVNDLGYVVGRSQTIDDRSAAFLYYDGIMLDLMQLIPEDSGWDSLSAAYDINENGVIVGYGSINGQNHAFMLQPESFPLPLPPTFWMMAAGLLPVGFKWGRKSK